MFFWIFVVMWIRWTLPRFRYDQLMGLGWKVLLPLALVYIMVIAGAIWAGQRFFPTASEAMQAAVLFGINLVIGWAVFYRLDRGHVVRGVGAQTLARARVGD